jgi:hypothetical protein
VATAAGALMVYLRCHEGHQTLSSLPVLFFQGACYHGTLGWGQIQEGCQQQLDC